MKDDKLKRPSGRPTGRPCKSADVEALQAPVTVRMTTAQRAMLEAAAKRMGRDPAVLAREALDVFSRRIAGPVPHDMTTITLSYGALHELAFFSAIQLDMGLEGSDLHLWEELAAVSGCASLPKIQSEHSRIARRRARRAFAR